MSLKCHKNVTKNVTKCHKNERMIVQYHGKLIIINKKQKQISSDKQNITNYDFWIKTFSFNLAFLFNREIMLIFL